MAQAKLKTEMDPQFTPGPWSFDGPTSSRIVWAGTERRVCFLTSDGLNLANARLIAAAPELYEALVAEVARARAAYEDTPAAEAHFCRNHAASLAALAKARGQ